MMGDFSHYDERATPGWWMFRENRLPFGPHRACTVRMAPETVRMITQNLLPKGNPFEVARVAGIMAAKRTPELIPMCHPLAADYVGVDFLIASETEIEIRSEIRLQGRTGAEMEALTAASVAALALYDMCKAVDKAIQIDSLRLIEKTGGKSDFSRS
jgi:cyclic pyranopterin phosphate synthase